MAKNPSPPGQGAVDLTTRYMGLTLKNPLIASASPLTGNFDNIRRIEDTGAGAVVLPSVFEEQIEQAVQAYEGLTDIALDSFPEVASFFPEPTLQCRSAPISRADPSRCRRRRNSGYCQPEWHDKERLDQLCQAYRGSRRQCD
jgi:hypothetical protein